MRGVITRAQVIAHPVVIARSYGWRVLLRALFASARETFLEVVHRCAEEEAHAGMADIDLVRTAGRFASFECRVRDVYRELARQHSAAAGAGGFFGTLADHEEGHALVLTRVRRELGKGRLWKPSRVGHLAGLAAFEDRLAAWEDEVRLGVSLARALELVEAIEGSELNVVFDTLSDCVDMRSRGRFERFFVLTERHLAYCAEGLRSLRARHGIAPPRAG